MLSLSTSLTFILQMAKVQAILTRRFDGSLGGLGFNEFMILFYLSQAPDEKLKRIDLANKLGLTASGVTRILLPMEKIGLVKKETNDQDARVSFVMLAPGGKMQLTEGIERAEFVTKEIIPADQAKEIEAMSQLFTRMSGTLT